MENAFRFFELVVHYNDVISVDNTMHMCKSLDRMKEREILNLNTQNSNDDYGRRDDVGAMMEDKDLWSYNQQYVQNQLDMIHAFLVHSNGQYFLNRYAKNEDADDIVDEKEVNISDADMKQSLER
eukprot:24849_1